MISTAIYRIPALLCSLAIAAAAAQQRAQPLDHPFDLEKAKSVLTRLIEKALQEDNVPSISIALVRGDAIVWKAAFGYANLRTRTPATPDTFYNTASTFKAVTATAIMQLAEQGKLKLHHPVNRYLGEFPIRDRLQSDQAVTFTHILSHWSGLTSWPGRAEAAMKPIWGFELPKTLAQLVPELYSIRPPETKFEYNNYGYGLAGFLIEKISNEDYETYVCNHILKPLGITTAHPVHPSPEMVELMALPYDVSRSAGQPRPMPQVHSDVYPAGNAWLTAEDMARFLGAHVNGGIFQGRRILSEASLREMHQPRFGGNYGYGFRVRQTPRAGTQLRHAGRMPGLSSMMMADVDARVGVYYMANATDVTSDIADAALALLRGDPYPPAERQSIQVNPEILQRYVGTYATETDVFDITRQGTGLFIQKNKKKKGELLAETATTFFIKNDSATITFDTDSDGVARMVVFEADWQLLVARRKAP